MAKPTTDTMPPIKNEPPKTSVFHGFLVLIGLLWLIYILSSSILA